MTRQFLAPARTCARRPLLVLVLAGALGLAGAASGQQIYRWTGPDGKVHFGNSPPPGTKDLEAKGTEKSDMQMQCEAAVKKDCEDYVKKFGKWRNSETYRDCSEAGAEQCERFAARAQPTQAAERFISTPTLRFDPTLGDSLTCEMRCNGHCRGQVEIRSDRVLKKGENYGNDRYTVEVRPRDAGSAFCGVSTPSDHVLLVLSVLRDGRVKDTVEGQ